MNSITVSQPEQINNVFNVIDQNTIVTFLDGPLTKIKVADYITQAVTQSTNNIVIIQAQVTQNTNDIVNIKLTLEEYNTLIQQNSVKIADLQTRMTTCETNIYNLQTAQQTMILDISTNRTNIDRLQNNITDLNTQMRQVENELLDVNSEIDTNKASITANTISINNLTLSQQGTTTQLTNLQNAFNTDHIKLSQNTVDITTLQSSPVDWTRIYNYPPPLQQAIDFNFHYLVYDPIQQIIFNNMYKIDWVNVINKPSSSGGGGTSTPNITDIKNNLVVDYFGAPINIGVPSRNTQYLIIFSSATSGSTFVDNSLKAIDLNDLLNTLITGAAPFITGSMIIDGQISNANMGVASISTNNYVEGSITNSKLADLSISTAKLLSGCVSTDKITLGAITNALIASATITADKLVNNTITAAQIADNTITNSKLVDNTIQSSKITNLTITAAKIANQTITSLQIADSTILGSNIAPTTITNTNIADNTIQGGKIAATTITAANIANATITGTQIANTTINTANLALQCITQNQIFPGAVNNVGLADNTIQYNHLSASFKNAWMQYWAPQIYSNTLNTLTPMYTTTPFVRYDSAQFKNSVGTVVATANGFLAHSMCMLKSPPDWSFNTTTPFNSYVQFDSARPIYNSTTYGAYGLHYLNSTTGGRMFIGFTSTQPLIIGDNSVCCVFTMQSNSGGYYAYIDNTGTYVKSSDAALKHNIRTRSNHQEQLDKILKLDIVTYSYGARAQDEINKIHQALDQELTPEEQKQKEQDLFELHKQCAKTQLGYTYQNLEANGFDYMLVDKQIMDDTYLDQQGIDKATMKTYFDENREKAISETAMIPYLVQAIKALNENHEREVQQLNQRISKLEQQVQQVLSLFSSQ